MKIKIYLSFLFLINEMLLFRANEKLWTRQYGLSIMDSGNSVTTDSKHFVYVAGFTYGSLGNSIASNQDVFLVKIDPTGNKIWTKQFGSSKNDVANSVATDSNNFVYLAGKTEGSLEGKTNERLNDAFLTKFDSEGNQLWTKQFGSSSEDNASSVTTDSNNFIYVAGFAGGSLDGKTNSGSSNAFLIKFDPLGNILWTKQFGSYYYATSVTTDSNNYVYVAGIKSGNTDEKTNARLNDAFLTKFDSEGNQLWNKQTEGSTTNANSVTTDSNNFVYVSGWTGGSLDGNIHAGFFDAFITKFDSEGNKIFTKQFGSSQNDFPVSVTTDSNNFLYVAGSTAGSIDGNTSTGNKDAFLVKYDSTGNKLWTKQFGTQTGFLALSVATDSNKFVYVAGQGSEILEEPGAIILAKFDSDSKDKALFGASFHVEFRLIYFVMILMICLI